MYSILIVDDEKIEREGISALIKQHGFELEVSTACNGEEALKKFLKKPYDILLTDIKMPYMTGIQLIEEISKRGMSPICIIYSAYGEFEYAQNAISLGVFQYLLKPILVEPFCELFKKVIEMCAERERKSVEEKKIIAEHKDYEREKKGRRILSYLESDQVEDINYEKVIFDNNKILPIILSSNQSLFSKHWESYMKEILDTFSDETVIANKDESQILLFIPYINQVSNKAIAEACEKLIKITRRKYQSNILLIIGGMCDNKEQLKAEYEKMKDQLDYQFFIDESIYLMEDEGIFLKKKTDMLPLYFKRIETSAKLGDYKAMEEEFDKAFIYVEKSVGFSSIYVKYYFTEMIKRCCEILNKEERLMEVVESIYESSTLKKVRDAAIYLIREFDKEGADKRRENLVVLKVKEIIAEEYTNSNLNVTFIADMLNISATYLSSLFKLETNENLVKYISKYRIEKAKELLETTNLRVSEIAERVGYFNPSYFISLFKTNVGFSPMKYREKAYRNE